MSMDCVVIGRLTDKVKDVIGGKTGKVLHTFTVASNRGFGDKKETDFYECVAFAPILDNQVPFLEKGVLVKVLGHMQTRKVTENGKGRTYYSLIVSSLELIWGKKASDKNTVVSAQVTDVPKDDFYDDEIPF